LANHGNKIQKPGTSPSVFRGNKIQWKLKKFILGTSPSVFYGNKIQFSFFDFWELPRACFPETKSSLFHQVNFQILYEKFFLGTSPVETKSIFYWDLKYSNIPIMILKNNDQTTFLSNLLVIVTNFCHTSRWLVGSKMAFFVWSIPRTRNKK